MWQDSDSKPNPLHAHSPFSRTVPAVFNHSPTSKIMKRSFTGGLVHSANKSPLPIGTLVALSIAAWGVASAQNLGAPTEWTNAADNGSWHSGSVPAASGATPEVGNPRIALPGLPGQASPIVIPVQNPATLATTSEFGSVPRGPATDTAETLAGWMPRTWPGQMTVAMAMVAAGIEKSETAAGPDTTTLDADSKCFSLALRVGQRIKEDPSSLLEVTASEVASNPTCACEVVKAALTAAKADPDMVAQVVEASALASPESLRIIAQCAIAVAPEALAKVQAVLARLDPGAGNGKGKGGAKDAKASMEKGGMEKAGIEEAPMTPPPNPLDLPPPLIPPVIVIHVTDPGGMPRR